jgi:hypothetical protein
MTTNHPKQPRRCHRWTPRESEDLRPHQTTFLLAHAAEGCRTICSKLPCLSANEDISAHTLRRSEPPASARTPVAGHIDGLRDRIANLGWPRRYLGSHRLVDQNETSRSLLYHC